MRLSEHLPEQGTRALFRSFLARQRPFYSVSEFAHLLFRRVEDVTYGPRGSTQIVECVAEVGTDIGLFESAGDSDRDLETPQICSTLLPLKRADDARQQRIIDALSRQIDYAISGRAHQRTVEPQIVATTDAVAESDAGIEFAEVGLLCSDALEVAELPLAHATQDARDVEAHDGTVPHS